MTLTQMEYILAVQKFRHFGKAAESCHVTQPTLSMQLQKCEEELGVVLFDRSKNPIVPTIEGEEIIKQAQNVIKEYRKIFDVIDQGKKDLTGDFRLGVIPTLSPYLIPLFVKSFCVKYPQINLYIEEFQTSIIMEKLDQDELDAALLVTPLRSNNLIERTLFYEPFHLFVAPQHPLSKKELVKESDLSGEGLWLLTEGHCMRNQMLNLCSLIPRRDILPNLRFESGNIETLLNMVLDAGGYTLVPHLCLDSLSVKRKKSIKSFAAPIPSREVSLVHSRIYHKEKLIDALEREIILSLPKGISSLKSDKLTIIEIEL